MTASAPWSVKGIDAKAREVAKDLARRSGMTLGEWLNQMILEGQDVGALISGETQSRESQSRDAMSREAARGPQARPAHMRAPQGRPAQSRPPYRDAPRYEDGGYDDEGYAPEAYAPESYAGESYTPNSYAPESYPANAYPERYAAERPAAPRVQAPYREPLPPREGQAYREPPRPAPFSSRAQPLAQPLSQRDLAREPGQRDLRRSIFEDRPRMEAFEEEGFASTSDDLGRVARALETLGSRIEGSESRSANAVRSVSQVVESLLGRLERTEAVHADTQSKLESQNEEVRASFERLSRAEEDQNAVAARLDQAERLIDAQAERLEGLSGHVRDERERVARVEEQLKSPQAIETVRAVEGALGKLANQLYEGDARTRDTLKDVRSDMVGLSHRLAQIELRDPERVAQGVIDKVVTRLAQRLETAEAQTSGALKALEQAFTTLDKRLTAAEGRGDVSDPEAARSFRQLAADLSRRVEDTRSELLGALNGGMAVSSDAALKALEARIDQAEKRSAEAIEQMGQKTLQEMLRVADGISRHVAAVEAGSQEGLKKVTETVEARFARSDTGHVQALERLGGEIARISERLGQKLVDSERRTTQVLTAIGEQVEQQRDQFRDDLGSRIRASEERTAKLLDEARARLDQKLAKVQTQTLLTEAAVRGPSRQDTELPNPFGTTRAPEPAPEVYAPAPVAYAQPAPEPVSKPIATVSASARSSVVEEDDDDIDLTGHLLAPLTDFKPEFDPFDDEDAIEAAEFAKTYADKPGQPLASPVPAPVAELEDEDDDIDPFADIEVSRKTAPPARAPRATAFAARAPRPAVATGPDFDAPSSREGLDFDDEPAPVSLSTRDALAAARAAVRASIEGTDNSADGTLGNLRSGVSRTREAQAKPGKGGDTLGRAVTATSVAVGATVLILGGGFGLYATLKGSGEKAQPEPTMAAAVINVTDEASPNASLEANLKAQYDMVDKALDARDPTAVVKLKALANQGYARAEWRLGNIYDKKFGVVTDPVEARKWTQRAADGMLPEAMNNLGYMYHGGDGGPQDRVMAAMWFRKAAERGFKDSQYNLGRLYQSGDGVALNPSEAYKWFSLAAKAGDKEAASQAALVKAQLSDSQRMKMDDTIANFVPISDRGVGEASALPTG